MFNHSVTQRGFSIITFEDDYGYKCSLQESSSVVPHIWLGIDDADPQIMASKVVKGGTGWIKYDIPSDVLLTTRMHLNVEQTKKLIIELQKFVDEYDESEDK